MVVVGNLYLAKEQWTGTESLVICIGTLGTSGEYVQCISLKRPRLGIDAVYRVTELFCPDLK